MTTQELYDRFQVPPGLRSHMIRVAQFTNAISSAWSGPTIDTNFLTRCALVHDLGNIVVFKQWFGEEASNLAYWQHVQSEIIAKYGTDDHEVTKRMLEEIHADPNIIATALAKSSARSPAIAASDDWHLKILLYADLRISPTGVVSLDDRLREMYARSDKHKNLTGIPEALAEVERQLQKHVSRDLASITDADLATDATNLLVTEI